MIFETSSEVSVFHVAGNPVVIRIVLGLRLVSMKCAKGSLKNFSLKMIRVSWSVIKPFQLGPLGQANELFKAKLNSK